MSKAVKPLLFIGVPTIGGHSFMFSQTLMGQAMPPNFGMQLRFLPGREVGDARNILFQEAVNLGAKYVCFRDEDTMAPVNLITSLLYHLENHPDWTFCGGLYATKTYPPHPLVFKEWGQGPFYDFRKGELIPTLFTGMGASLIRVSDTFDLPCDEYEVMNPWKSEPMKVRELFKTISTGAYSVNGAELRSGTEDAYFFKKLEAAGRKAYIDTNMVCGHWDNVAGTMFWPAFDGDYAKTPDAWSHEPRVINLGAGADYDPYELQVDLRDTPNITFRCDIRSLPTEWENTVDIAKAHHVLEHFDFQQTPVVLAEWLRVLKPGGKLEIRVPDLEAVAENIVKGRFDAVVQGNIYGDQGHPFWNQEAYGGYDGPRWLPHSFQHNHHNSGFTARHLLNLLKDVGFVEGKAERHTDSWEIRAEAQKPAAVSPTAEAPAEPLIGEIINE
jgi:SAM-dependent methyltransferase